MSNLAHASPKNGLHSCTHSTCASSDHNHGATHAQLPVQAARAKLSQDGLDAEQRGLPPGTMSMQLQSQTCIQESALMLPPHSTCNASMAVAAAQRRKSVRRTATIVSNCSRCITILMLLSGECWVMRGEWEVCVEAAVLRQDRRGSNALYLYAYVARTYTMNPDIA